MTARKWGVESYVHAQPTGGDPRICRHSKIRVILHEDRSWVIITRQADDSFDLMLQGKPDIPFGVAMGEILAWLFGVPAQP